MRGRRSNWHIWNRDFSNGQVETLCGWVLTDFKRGEEDIITKHPMMRYPQVTCVNCNSKRDLLEEEEIP